MYVCLLCHFAVTSDDAMEPHLRLAVCICLRCWLVAVDRYREMSKRLRTEVSAALAA